MAVRRKKAGGEVSMITALKELCAEKEISQDALFDAIKSALIFACKKTTSAEKKVIVDLDKDSGTFHVYELRDVVEEVTNKNREISLADARKIDYTYDIGSIVRTEVSPNNFGRIAAQAAKQFVMQKIREAERGVVYDEFTNSDNDVVTGTVTRIEDGNVIVDIGKTEAVLVPVEQLRSDNFQIGDRVRAYVAEVRKMGKGPQVYLSRTHPGLLRRLFELEVPEIQDGIISIKTVAREAGNRSKIAVVSSNPDIDPVGACLGEHGVRAQAISKELGNEKIDVVKWDEDPALFIANALSPSKVMKVSVNEYDKVSHVVVPNNQLSLAIGKEGQNARLAAKLTGWKIDIKSKAQAKDEILEPDFREVIIGGVRPKKQQKKVKPPKPEKVIVPGGENVQGESKKKKKKKKKAAAAPVENTAAAAPVTENIFGDNLFEDNPFEDSPFETDDNAAVTEKPVAQKSKPAQDNSFENPFGDNPFENNPFEDNPFGENTFEETPAEVKPAKKDSATVENPFGENTFEDTPAEVKPANKNSATVENPFGENSFEDTTAEVKPAKKDSATIENPFGENSFEDTAAEVKPAKKNSATVENPFGENTFEETPAEVKTLAQDSKPAKKSSAKKPAKKKSEPEKPVENNPFGDNPFEDNPFEE